MLLAHLVTGRYRDGSAQEPYTPVKTSPWIVRMFRRIIRKA